MTVYRCCFTFHGLPRMVESPKGLAVFKDGFWITVDGQISNGADAHAYILPHMITVLVKVEQ